MDSRRYNIDMHPSPKRRRLRFGLRTMFVVLTVAACWLGYEANWIRQRREAAAMWSVTRAMDPYTNRPDRRTAPGLLWLFAEPGYVSVIVRFRYRVGRTLTLAEHSEWQRTQQLFSEADVSYEIDAPLPPFRPAESDIKVWGRPASRVR